MRRLDGITNSRDMSLCKLQEIVKGSLACCSPWGHKESTWLSDWTATTCIKIDEIYKILIQINICNWLQTYFRPQWSKLYTTQNISFFILMDPYYQNYSNYYFVYHVINLKIVKTIFFLVIISTYIQHNSLSFAFSGPQSLNIYSVVLYSKGLLISALDTFIVVL